MRELDVLLTRYLENEYAADDEPRKAAFRHLLTLSDPELVGYLLGGETPEEPALAALIQHIRS